MKRKTVLVVEFQVDELALRLLRRAIGINPPAHYTTAQALDSADLANPGIAEHFRALATEAITFVRDQMAEGKRPN